MQKVIHVQSINFAPGLTGVAQFEYLLAVTVPSKSMPQLKWGVFSRGIILWLPIMEPNTVGWPPVTWPSRQCRE